MSIPNWENYSLDQILRNISIQVEQRERNGLINIHNFNERALYNKDFKMFDLVFTINWNTIYLGIIQIHKEESRLLQENQMLFANVFKQNGTHLLIGNSEWNKTMMECEYDNIEQQNDFLSSTYDELIKMSGKTDTEKDYRCGRFIVDQQSFNQSLHLTSLLS